MVQLNSHMQNSYRQWGWSTIFASCSGCSSTTPSASRWSSGLARGQQGLPIFTSYSCLSIWTFRWNHLIYIYLYSPMQSVCLFSTFTYFAWMTSLQTCVCSLTTWCGHVRRKDLLCQSRCCLWFHVQARFENLSLNVHPIIPCAFARSRDELKTTSDPCMCNMLFACEWVFKSGARMLGMFLYLGNFAQDRGTSVHQGGSAAHDEDCNIFGNQKTWNWCISVAIMTFHHTSL